jgi:ATP-dependent RNA helicase HelY
MKEVVEACFVEGLVKVVFATETLAVGINMPARTVVIEKLTKFTGDHHERLTPGQYTQLTGRAGRRGIDEIGTAVVQWSPWVRFDEVAELAASSSFHLRSAFHPTYNMAANLIRTYTNDEAHRLLNLSFAQFQADRDVVRLEARLERRRAALDELRGQSVSEHGDIEEYRRLRDAARDRGDRERARQRTTIDEGLAGLKPGVVIHVTKGTYRGPAAVLASTHRKGALRVTVVTRSAKLMHVTADDFDAPPHRLGNVTLPKVYAPNRKDYRSGIARSMRRMNAGPPRRRPRDDRAATSSLDLHPVARDPELREKLAAAGHADRIAREIADLERRVGGKHQSLGQDFDRVLEVLEAYGHIDRARWQLTDAGEVLARIFHECDLLVAEAVLDGLLDDLDAPRLAALVSTMVYEHRSGDPPPAPWFPDDEARRRWRRLAAISDDLQASERRAGLEPHRPPDATFGAIAYAWVAGEGFAEVVGEEEVTGGDFVRTTKQLIDLLRQIALVAPQPATRRTAEEAAARAFRGVVADSAAPTADTTGSPTVP